MSKLHRVKITVFLEGLAEYSKNFVGTTTQVYMEAMDWMNEMTLRYIEENDIEEEWEQELIINSATHEIEWNYMEDVPIQMYAVIESDVMDPVYGVYPTRADAEEAILAECEGWAYEVMMTEDPNDFFGDDEWFWPDDYRWLMRDAGKTFHIQEIPVFGAERIDN